MILQFFLGNDLVENLRSLDTESLRPYLVLDDDQLALDDRYRATPEYRAKTSLLGRASASLMVHSYIMQTLVQVRDGFKIGAWARPGGSKDAADHGPSSSYPSGEPGVDSGIFSAPDEARWRRAWEVTERMLQQFTDEVRATGARPLLLIAGTGAQVHPDPRVSAALADRLGLPDLGYPVRRLSRAASRFGLPAVNLPAIMAAEAERRGVLLHGFANAIPGFGHWNEAGHRLVGAVAAEALCRQLESR